VTGRVSTPANRQARGRSLDLGPCPLVACGTPAIWVPLTCVRSFKTFSIVFLLALPTACSSGDALSDSRERELEQYWELYQADDPSWDDVRDRWYAYGGTERRTLVDSLIREMLVRADQAVRTERGLEPAWRRSQTELLELGPAETVPLLIVALRTYRDPASVEVVADTLVQFGALDAVLEALSEQRPGDSSRFVVHGCRVLVQIGGPRALDRVGRELASNPDWQVRATAAEMLGSARQSDRGRATQVLIKGLRDEDPFVVKQSLRSLVVLRAVNAAPVVAVMLEEATRDGDAERVRLAVETLRSLTGARVPGDSPEAWRIEAARAARDTRE